MLHATFGAVVSFVATGFEFTENSVDAGAGQAKGGGLYAEADGGGSEIQLTLQGGLFAENDVVSTTQSYGGAMELRAVNDGNAFADVRNVTATGNTAEHGGAFYLFTSSGVDSMIIFRAAHATIAGNTATGDGGGLATQGVIDLTLQATLLVGNVATMGPQCDFSAEVTITDTENNIGPVAGCSFVGASNQDSDSIDILRPLANNGSSSRTMLPVSPGLAANAYPAPCINEAGSSLFIDQRGYARPTDPFDAMDGNCDIGAAEVSADE